MIEPHSAAGNLGPDLATVAHGVADFLALCQRQFWRLDHKSRKSSVMRSLSGKPLVAQW